MKIVEYPNRKTSVGTIRDYTWEELKDRLRDAVVTRETLDEYQRMTNEQRTEIKDVGGYVGGELEGGRRSKRCLLNRSIVTIDADEARPDDVEAFQMCSDYKFFVHTTHTSTADNPRLRWVFPLSRPVTPDEYSDLVFRLAQEIGIDTIDESTDQPERLMFWPSVALDGDFQTWEGGTRDVDPEELLQFTIGDVERIEEPDEDYKETTESVVKNGVDVQNVVEGNRNKQLFSYAALLRGYGLDDAGLRHAILDYNDRYCVPPLPPSEVDTVARSVCTRYKPGERMQDSLRDAWEDFSDLGVIVADDKKTTQKKHIQIESANSLGLRDIEPPKFIVENMITSGITILASPPKFGKSWLCTDLCQRIANGEKFLGLKTTKTKVLYLALEDGEYRLKDRGLKVSGGKPLPKDMFISLEAPALQDGLIHELQLQVAKLGGDVGCIVIDTLQKVRGIAGKNEGVYGYDYRELGELHKFAINSNIALILVHHLNKGGDDNDFVSRLNGSTGVSGAADTIITMTRASRGDKQTRMNITGRDVKERTLVLQMNWSTYRWENLGDEDSVQSAIEDSEYENDPIVQTVRMYLDTAEDMLEDNIEQDTVTWSCTSQELLDAIVSTYGDSVVHGSATTVGQDVRKLQEKLKIIDGIEYDYVVDGSRREHRFKRYIV